MTIPKIDTTRVNRLKFDKEIEPLLNDLYNAGYTTYTSCVGTGHPHKDYPYIGFVGLAKEKIDILKAKGLDVLDIVESLKEYPEVFTQKDIERKANQLLVFSDKIESAKFFEIIKQELLA